jgi:AcrR family transcriptional regulator
VTSYPPSVDQSSDLDGQSSDLADTAPRRSRRLGRPPGVDGEDTVRRILGVAERQFASLGYGTTTNKTIADECDLSAAALYHHFGAKVALYEAVSQSVYPSMIEAYRGALTGATGLRARIKVIMNVSIDLNRHRPSLAGFVMGAPVEARRHPELRTIVSHHFGVVERFVEQLVDEAHRAGELSGEVSQADVVDMLLSILHGFAHLAYRTDSIERHTQVVRVFERLLDGALISD